MSVLQVPNGQQLFCTNNGVPAASGTVEMYIPGTLTPKNTWQDPLQTAFNTNPIVLDAAGRCTIWGEGFYRQIFKDFLGNTIWDKVVSAGTGQEVFWGGLSGGAPNLQTLTVPGFTFQDGATIQWIAFFTNTGPLFIEVNGGTGVEVFSNSQSGAVPLIGSEIIAGNIITMVADETLGGFRLTTGTANTRNLNVLGTLTRSGILTVAPLGASINDFDPPGVEDSSVLRIASTIPINWSGLNAPALNGTYYTVDNYGTQVITLLANSGLSSPGNKFLMTGNFPLLPSSSIELHYDDTSAGWRVIGGSVNSRVTLTANRTYYVNPTGSDSNDGLDPARPFQTLQKADNVISGLDFNGFAVTMQLADGTYNAGMIASGKKIGQKFDTDYLIQGNIGTPANVIISASASDCFLVQDGAMLKLDGLEMRTTGSGNCIEASVLGRVVLGVLRFGACAGNHMDSSYQAAIYTSTNYAITGGANKHYSVSNGAYLRLDNAPTVTITGSPTFTLFADVLLDGFLAAGGTTYSGAVTGTIKYQVASAGKISSGNNINLFPGASPGVGTDFQTSPFGWYH